MKALFSEVLVLFIFCSSNVYSEESDCEGEPNVPFVANIIYFDYLLQ